MSPGDPGLEEVSITAMDDREPGASAFVLMVWVACGVCVLGLAGYSAAETPRLDDWANVSVLTGDRPLTVGWLWSQHNEHRIPLPRLIIVGLSKLTGGSFRAPSILNAGLLAVASGALVLASRVRRGWTSYSDAFLPLLLSGPSHGRNILVGFQIQLVSSTVLYAFVLSIIVRRPEGLRTLSSALMAGIVILLPLCGANGVAFVPALALAMVIQAIADRKRSLGRSVILLLGAVASLSLVYAYFRGWKAAGHGDAPASIVEKVRVTLQFLAGGWGVSAAETWPWSGGLVAGLLIGGVVALVIAWRREPEGRMRTTWLVAATGAIGSLALGIGSGRAGMGDRIGFEPRYVTLAAPAMVMVYLAWLNAGRSMGRFSQMTLFTLACLATWPDAEAMIEAAREQRSASSELAADIARGLPPSRLIARHIGFLHTSHDELGTGMALLKRARLGMYANLADEPPMEEVKLPVEPTSMVGMEGRAGHYRATTVDPYLNYNLSEPRFVAGVEIRYRHANSQGLPGRFVFLWKREGDTYQDPPQRQSIWTLPTGKDRTVTIWLYEKISRVMIQPDNKPCEFDVDELILLVPAGAR
ncbi:hypothetical protein P12x_000831 [Tundrisphaera lichenicola]|uniref:hypothetical protein n=1 Tax=Tundrisphaera lichenicola TaxID=2029860 RepID=UPI003EBF672B